MKLNSLLLLAFAFVLVGQGCVGDDSVTVELDAAAEDEGVMADSDGMHGEEDMMELGDSEIVENTGDVEEDENADVVVRLSGDNFSYSRDEIRVEEGQTVQIIFTSESGFHDWVVDEFDAATEKVQTGGVTSVTFVADQAGEFEYYCSVGEHREMGMVGTLIVE